jgi:hypothetical protein
MKRCGRRRSVSFRYVPSAVTRTASVLSVSWRVMPGISGKDIAGGGRLSQFLPYVQCGLDITHTPSKSSSSSLVVRDIKTASPFFFMLFFLSYSPNTARIKVYSLVEIR